MKGWRKEEQVYVNEVMKDYKTSTLALLFTSSKKQEEMYSQACKRARLDYRAKKLDEIEFEVQEERYRFLSEVIDKANEEINKYLEEAKAIISKENKKPFEFSISNEEIALQDSEIITIEVKPFNIKFLQER